MGDDNLKTSSSEDTNNSIPERALQQVQHSAKMAKATKRRATAIGKSDQSNSSSPRHERKSLPKKRSATASNASDGSSSKRGREIPWEAAAADESRAQQLPNSALNSPDARAWPGKIGPEGLFASQQSPSHRGVASQMQQQQPPPPPLQHGQLEHLMRPPMAASLNMQQPPLTAAEQIILMSSQRRPSPFPQSVEYQQQQHQQLQILLHLQQQQQAQQHAQQMNSRSMAASLAHMPFTTGEGASLGRVMPLTMNPYAASLANLGGGPPRAALESAGASLSHSNLLPAAAATTSGRLGRYEDPSNPMDLAGMQDPSSSMELLASLLPAAASGTRDMVSAEIPETPRNPELEWRSVQLCQQAQEFIEAWKASQDAETLEELKQEGRWNRKRKTPKKKR